jgi:hypothetical protein
MTLATKDLAPPLRTPPRPAFGIVQTLRDEHQRIAAQLESLLTDRALGPEARTAALREVRRAFEDHAVHEEAFFYPALESEPHLGEVLAKLRREHRSLLGRLRELETISPEHPHWEPLLEVLRVDFDGLVRDETDMLFPAADQLLERAESNKIDALHTLRALRINRGTAPRL